MDNSSIVTTPITHSQPDTPILSTEKQEEISYYNPEFPPAANIEEYVATRKEPYTFEYLNLSKDLRGVPLYQKWASEIDEFVKGEMSSLELKDSIDTYDSIIKEVINSIGLHPETGGRAVLEKVYKWIKNVVGPQRRLERRKQEIINGKL